MPDIKTLGILTINCNTIDVKEVDGTENFKTKNTHNSQDQTSKQHT